MNGQALKSHEEYNNSKAIADFEKLQAYKLDSYLHSFQVQETINDESE